MSLKPYLSSDSAPGGERGGCAEGENDMGCGVSTYRRDLQSLYTFPFVQ